MKRLFIPLMLLLCILSFASCKHEEPTDSNTDTELDNKEEIDNNQTNCHQCTYEANEEIYPPSCESGGYSLRTCICGRTIQDKLTEALGHAWGEWYIEDAPTANSAGKLKRICNNGHSETETLPALNTNDYTIQSINGDSVNASCDIPTSVYYVFCHTFYDGEDSREQKFKIQADYLLDHSYSDKYVYTCENHYKHCIVCGNFSTDTQEAHTILGEECSVCHFVARNVSYSEEYYGLAVSYNANEESIIIPDLYTGDSVSHAGKVVKGIKSFGNNDKLRAITIPESIKYIEPFAFEGCTSLESVYYEGTIGEWCSINFGANSNPMNYASNFFIKNTHGAYQRVTEIYLPDSLSVISSSAFEGFKSISSLKIPKSIISLGTGLSSVFSSDTIISNIYYDGDYTDWCKIAIKGQFSNPMQFTNSFYMTDRNGKYYTPTEMIIPDTFTEIGDFQFTGYKALSVLKISSSLTSIGDYSFFGCSSLLSVDTSSGCEKIGSYAFGGCSMLSTLFLPSNITESNDFAFEACSNLHNIYYKGNWDNWSKIKFSTAASNPMHVNRERSYNSAVKFYRYFKAENTYYSSEAEIISLSQCITAVGDYQFYGFSAIAQIIIPDGAISIGKEAIAYCGNLNALVIPASVKSIGKNVTKNMKNSVEIYYGGTPDEWKKIRIDSQNDDLNEAQRCYYAPNAESIIPSHSCWAYHSGGYIAKWYRSSSDEEWYLL